jgi:hypothetical protein
MKNDEEIYNILTSFILNEKYKKYFITNIEQLKSNFEQLKKFINENNRTPFQTSKKIDEKQLNNWLCVQKKITRREFSL